VIKVKSRKSGVFYAMKVVAKKIIENSHMIDQLKNEVNIMSKLSHPRIIQLHTIFEDQKNIYFVLELAEEVGQANPGASVLEAASGRQVR
jgi:serine/threonine protein kinase